MSSLVLNPVISLISETPTNPKSSFPARLLINYLLISRSQFVSDDRNRGPRAGDQSGTSGRGFLLTFPDHENIEGTPEEATGEKRFDL